ncbi:MAG: hypothetical protein U0W24_07525 [Bacteroidales bacterium]
MKKFVLIFFLVTLVLACEVEQPVYKSFPEGTYTGTFQREYGALQTDIVTVTIEFSGNHWSGSGELAKYPALCHGTFSITNNAIVFVNECAWTAEFDWSLILAGEYVITESGKTLEFYRINSVGNFGSTDIYKLTKVEE